MPPYFKAANDLRRGAFKFPYALLLAPPFSRLGDSVQVTRSKESWNLCGQGKESVLVYKVRRARLTLFS